MPLRPKAAAERIPCSGSHFVSASGEPAWSRCPFFPEVSRQGTPRLESCISAHRTSDGAVAWFGIPVCFRRYNRSVVYLETVVYEALLVAVYGKIARGST